MLEKIKEVPFIEQSKAVKLLTAENQLVMERFTKVIWAAERPKLEIMNELNCYVEADKFFNLFNEIKDLKQTTCLEVTLKNGARYDLPFLQVEWERPEISMEETDTISFKLEDLMLCTLKNLVKPQLQCIYIDEKGAISCDFVTACVSDIVKSSRPFLLPPDVQELVSGRIAQVAVTPENLYVSTSDVIVVTSSPELSESTKNELVGLRDMLQNVSEYTQLGSLNEGIKRLMLFGDFLNFTPDKVLVGQNFEPFNFKQIDKKYEIRSFAKLLPITTEVSELDGNLILKSSTSRFLVSAVEEND